MPNLTELYQEISACTLCRLHESRTNTVPGEGPPDAEIMFIGEGPGFHEDQQGRPFVGRSGDLLEKFLAKKGYEVTVVTSGFDALAKVKENRPHIVLLDIKMPGMDGIETLEKIRELDKEVGVIMITGVKKDEAGRTCMTLGAYGYITKPLDLDYLEKALLLKLLEMTKG